ncbi:RNA-binding protein 10 isoform X1 [Stigmatopora nigra]
MDTERRGGRGDRIGRYGTHSDHNFRDMDYRGFGQEDETAEAKYDVCNKEDRPYIHNESPVSASEVLPGHLQEHQGFDQRENGGSEVRRLLWPPQSSTDAFDEEKTKRDFERLRTGSEGKGRGKSGRSFIGNSNMDTNRAHQRSASFEPTEHNFDKEEGRFAHGAGMKKTFPSEAEGPGLCSSETDLSYDEMEQKDQDYRADQDCKRPSNIVMLRLLPPNATANEIWASLQEQGIQPKEVRLMRNKSSGQSRGFAFVEFNLIQEATRWMETNQCVLKIMGHRVSMHYSNPKPRANEDWLCNKCGVQNFKRRERCFKCSAPKSEAELKLPQMHTDGSVALPKESAQGLLPLPTPFQSSVSTPHSGLVSQQADVANDTLILRNLGPHTNVDSILSALASFATLSPSNIRLIKDKNTNLNRGFAFLQLSTIVEASQLLQILQALKQPLSIDGKVIVVEFAKGSKRDVFVADTCRVNAASVASTAIAAAQWAVTQTSQNGGGEFYQHGAITYPQEGNGYSLPNGQHFQVQGDPRLPVLPSAGTPLRGIYSASANQAAVVPGQALASALAIVQPPQIQPPTAQVEIVGKPQPASSSQPATPGTAHELQQYPVPDVTTYQYDESSGYYYDPLTGLYYDPNSQYYYNPHTQQFMYWEGEKHTYISVTSEKSSSEGVPTADDAAPTDMSLNFGSKEKKDKPKSKTAQQIAKDMERWAKSLNRHKENMRSVSSSLTAGSSDRRESASADAGYAVLEKKGTLLERPQMFLDQLRQLESPPPQQPGLVPAYSGESDSEEEAGEKGGKEGKMTDWEKLACLLCRRQFPSKEALIRHQQLSELHKQNLEQRRIPETAGKERQADGLQAPDSKRRKTSAMDGISGSSLGARMLQGGMKKGLLMRNMQMQ